jgi:hypothetical protein
LSLQSSMKRLVLQEQVKALREELDKQPTHTTIESLLETHLQSALNTLLHQSVTREQSAHSAMLAAQTLSSQLQQKLADLTSSVSQNESLGQKLLEKDSEIAKLHRKIEYREKEIDDKRQIEEYLMGQNVKEGLEARKLRERVRELEKQMADKETMEKKSHDLRLQQAMERARLHYTALLHNKDNEIAMLRNKNKHIEEGMIEELEKQMADKEKEMAEKKNSSLRLQQAMERARLQYTKVLETCGDKDAEIATLRQQLKTETTRDLGKETTELRSEIERLEAEVEEGLQVQVEMQKQIVGEIEERQGVQRRMEGVRRVAERKRAEMEREGAKEEKSEDGESDGWSVVSDQ